MLITYFELSNKDTFNYPTLVILICLVWLNMAKYFQKLRTCNENCLTKTVIWISNKNKIWVLVTVKLLLRERKIKRLAKPFWLFLKVFVRILCTALKIPALGSIVTSFIINVLRWKLEDRLNVNVNILTWPSSHNL